MTTARLLLIVTTALGLSGLSALAPAQQAPPADAGDASTTQPAPSDEEGPEVPAPDEAVKRPELPSQEEVLEQFERSRPENKAIQPTVIQGEGVGPDAKAEEEKSKVRARYPDGYLLIDRAGRFSREGSWWVFTFESDSESYEEPPLRVLPNKMLERVVFEVQGTPNLVFIVSGEVTDFQGENYLLLRKLLRRRDMGNLKK